MAKYGGSSVAVILVDQFNLIPSVVENLEGPTIEAVLKAVTGLGDTWEQHQPAGIRKMSAAVDGFFNDATTGAVAAVVDKESTSRVLSVCWHGNSYGAKATCCLGGFTAKHSRIAKLDDLQRLKFTFSGSGQVDDDAVILYPLTTLTADLDTTGANSQDAGASSAGGYAAYIHVTAYSGFSSIVAKVRHSSDDVTYADLATFTTITAVGAERITASGTVNRHLAVDLNVTGAGSADIFVAVKRL